MGVLALADEDAALSEYFAMPDTDRKLVVDMFRTLSGMPRADREMALHVVREYARTRPARSRAVLRLVA